MLLFSPEIREAQYTPDSHVQAKRKPPLVLFLFWALIPLSGLITSCQPRAPGTASAVPWAGMEAKPMAWARAVKWPPQDPTSAPVAQALSVSQLERNSATLNTWRLNRTLAGWVLMFTPITTSPRREHDAQSLVGSNKAAA